MLLTSLLAETKFWPAVTSRANFLRFARKKVHGNVYMCSKRLWRISRSTRTGTIMRWIIATSRCMRDIGLATAKETNWWTVTAPETIAICWPTMASPFAKINTTHSASKSSSTSTRRVKWKNSRKSSALRKTNFPRSSCSTCERLWSSRIKRNLEMSSTTGWSSCSCQCLSKLSSKFTSSRQAST